MKAKLILIIIPFLLFSQQRESNSEKEILRKLKQIEETYIKNLDFRERRKAIRLIDDVISLIKGKKQRPIKRRFNDIIPDHEFEEMKELPNKYSRLTNVLLESGKYIVKYQFTRKQLIELMKTYDSEYQRVALFEIIYPKLKNKRNSKQFIDLVDDYRFKKQIKNVLLNYNSSNKLTRKISKSDFNKLKKITSSYSNDKKKMVNMINLVSMNLFSLKQLKSIVKKKSFDDAKVNLIELIYPNVTNKENARELLNLVTFERSKEKITELIIEFSDQNYHYSFYDEVHY